MGEIMREITYRYRVYPTKEQETKILKICGCVRFLYNGMLQDRTKHYRKTGEWEKLNYKDYLFFPFLAKTDQEALKWAQGDLERAYRNFFYAERTKPDRYRPESIFEADSDPNYKLMDTDLYHYPRYKRKKDSKQSYTTRLSELKIENNRIQIPKVGPVKIKYHRELPQDATQISATVLKKRSGSYYLLLRLQIPDVEEKKDLNTAVGVVFAPGVPVVRSDGVSVFFRHQDEELTKKMKKAYKTLQRRVPGSKRYEEQRKRLASLYEHRANQRRDDLHKASRQITNAFDVIYVKNPDVTNRLKEAKTSLARAKQLDEAWWTFTSLLSYKAKGTGKRLYTIPGYPCFDICSECGHWEQQGVVGKWICPKCGFEADRYENAAMNLENLAFKDLKE